MSAGLGRLVIAGLGNAGADYARTRHNVGFLAIDALAKAFEANGAKRVAQGRALEVVRHSNRVSLFKPGGFMNVCGSRVGGFLHR